MELVEIAKRGIRIHLSPEDSQRLALALKAASRIAGGDFGVTHDDAFGFDCHEMAERFYQLVASTFEASGMACVESDATTKR